MSNVFDTPSTTALTVCLLIASFSLASVVHANELLDGTNEPIDRSLLKGMDLDGQLHRFGDVADCRGMVFVFLSTNCPVSNGSIPAIHKIHAQFHQSGIEFYGVISSPGTRRADAIQHREDYKIGFPVIFDGSNSLRNLLKPTHTPHAIVVNAIGSIAYSGRIDNRFTSIGRRRDQATEHDLHDAVRSVVLGRPISQPVTEPIGCRLEHAPSQPAGTNVTFHRDIAPILYANCSECHRPGEAAPFSLLSYEDACGHAEQIVTVTQSKFMPPWHPTEGFGHFRDERRLSANEIAILKDWVDAGLPKGDPEDALTAPTFLNGWRLGTPDLVLTMNEAFELGADGPDVHQHFVLPTNLTKNRLVSAVEFRPGNPRVVHHACFYVDVTGAGRRLANRYPDVGYGSFVGPGFFNIGALRSWLPGMSPQRLPEGTGQALYGNSDLVLEIHYQRSGKVETDQSQVGIFFAHESSRHLVCEIQVMDKTLVIPAGEENFRYTASYTLPTAATLLDAAPHMHLLGREMKAVATLPNGTVRPLVWIQDWDFNWQGQYLYTDPIRLPRGTRIDVEARYDNSDRNPLNPHSPPRQVTWGEQTNDEMGICHFRYQCDSMKDLKTMNGHYLKYADQQQRRYERMLQRVASAPEE